MKFVTTFLIFIFILLNNLSAKENSASIFVYHRFGEENYPSTNVKMDQFKKHINELTENNYNVLPVPEIINAFINKTDLPEKTIGITIDDALVLLKEKLSSNKSSKKNTSKDAKSKRVGTKKSSRKVPATTKSGASVPLTS